MTAVGTWPKLTGTTEEATMFASAAATGYREMLPGVRLKTLVHGDRTLLTEVRLAADAVVPEHSHPHEQTGYLVSGRLRFTVAGEVHDVGPGDSWSLPGDEPHAATALEDSVVVEVFAPVREDYLAVE